MKKACYKTGYHKADHTTYGGEVTLFDFDGRPTMAIAAKKIMSDLAFDKRCRENYRQRDFIKSNRYLE